MQKYTYDVAIVGGGMVGSALACALAESDLKVALVEPHAPPVFDPEAPCGLRVSAISYASENILKALGAWEGIISRRACPYRRMLVWEKDQAIETNFNSASLGLPHLGHIVENAIVQLALHESMSTLDQVTMYCPAESETVDLMAQKITLNTGESFSAKLIVAADGAHSRLREMAGIPLTQRTYNQHALVATVETVLPQQDITWQCYAPTGPQAFLPLPGHQGSLVWYASPAQVQTYHQIPESKLMDEIQRAFPERLGEITGISSKGHFPLIRRHAQTYVRPGFVLLGDAAHTIHPQIGQGVNMGFLDMAALAETILQAHAQGEDFSRARVLKRFERWRRWDNTLTIGITDQLYSIFRSQSRLAQHIRNTGFALADRTPPLNKLLASFAVGKMPHLPRVTRKL